MKRWFYLALLLGTIAGSYVWLKIPDLAEFGPQVFLVALLCYVAARKLLSQTSSFNILPQFESWDTALLVAATVMLVGSTGGPLSLFFALNYILVFFVVFSSGDITALATGLALSLAYFGLSTSFTQSHVTVLLSVPLVTFLFTMAKNQYLLAVKATTNILHDDDWNTQRADSTGWFLEKFLRPTIVQLKELTGNPQHNQQAILEHLIKIESRTEQLLQVYDSSQNTEPALPTDEKTPTPDETTV